MKKVMYTIFLTIIASTFAIDINGQQNIIADKDNTHPEKTQQQYSVARVFLLSAIQMNGYNEIRWSATAEEETRRYIVEYSPDGINYQSAGEVTPFKGTYLLKHQTLDPRAFLYRIRIEKKDGRFVNTSSVFMEGATVSPVLLYPTIVEGNTINLRMELPVERIAVISSDGKEIFSKQMGGQTGTTQIVIPSISRGNYFMLINGVNWKITEKFVVARM